MAATAQDVGRLAFTFTIRAAVFAPLFGWAMATWMGTLVFSFHGGASSFQLDQAGGSLFREIRRPGSCEIIAIRTTQARMPVLRVAQAFLPVRV
jgi:hypothetical protein